MPHLAIAIALRPLAVARQQAVSSLSGRPLGYGGCGVEDTPCGVVAGGEMPRNRFDERCELGSSMQMKLYLLLSFRSVSSGHWLFG